MAETKVKWFLWGKEAFKKAKAEDKPILLDVSAVWCHWCHVMDQTTYSDTAVARLIRQKFIAIRVNRDERPDIDKRYNMGGWPTTAILTPDGDVITGATYVPPQQMKPWLENVSRFYRNNKAKIAAETKKLASKEVEEQTLEFNSSHELFQSVIDNVTNDILSGFDSAYGGFGNAPKFPHSKALSFALVEYHIHRYKALLRVAAKTLDKMSSSSIYDAEEGGFFRYSTTRNWNSPHYEKMCIDNANLLVNYLELYQVTKEGKFREVAQGILDYVEANLRDQNNGGFYGSQDADEEYYTLGLPSRRKRSSPAVDKNHYTDWSALMTSSYFFASIVLNNSLYQTLALQTINLLLEKSFRPESGMFHYYLDDEQHLPGLLSDQASMIRCLIDAYQSTADRQFLDYAETIAQLALESLWNDSGAFNDRPKNAKGLGNLKSGIQPFDENSVAADALLRLHYLTGKDGFLNAARQVLKHFASSYQRHGLMAAAYALAVELYLRPIQLHIVGSLENSTTNQLWKESLKTYSPLKVIEILDPRRDRERLAELKYPLNHAPIVYVCSAGTCLAVTRPANVAETIQDLQIRNKSLNRNSGLQH